MDLGVYVHSTAIGAPVAVYANVPGYGQTLSGLVNRFGANLINTTQCVPVMIRNPVSCRKGGSISIFTPSTYAELVATSDDGTCQVSNAVLGLAPTTRGMMAKGMCPIGEVGQVMVVVAGTGAYSGWIALSV